MWPWSTITRLKAEVQSWKDWTHSARKDRDTYHAETVAQHDELNTVKAERDAYQKERDTLKMKLAANKEAKAQLVDERDTAQKEIAILQASGKRREKEIGLAKAAQQTQEETIAELRAALDIQTQYRLVAVVEPSTTGRNREPCLRFVIREEGRGTSDPLCVSDVNGVKDVAEVVETLHKLAHGKLDIRFPHDEPELQDELDALIDAEHADRFERRNR